jgi:hypothetical protein
MQARAATRLQVLMLVAAEFFLQDLLLWIAVSLLYHLPLSAVEDPPAELHLLAIDSHPSVVGVVLILWICQLPLPNQPIIMSLSQESKLPIVLNGDFLKPFVAMDAICLPLQPSFPLTIERMTLEWL